MGETEIKKKRRAYYLEMVKHNNVIPNVHMRKHWQRGLVKTFFNQAANKKSRIIRRQERATRLEPRPVQLLRPAVRAMTQRYNRRQRIGRGFTLQEIKAAGLGALSPEPLALPSIIEERINLLKPSKSTFKDSSNSEKSSFSSPDTRTSPRRVSLTMPTPKLLNLSKVNKTAIEFCSASPKNPRVMSLSLLLRT